MAASSLIIGLSFFLFFSFTNIKPFPLALASEEAVTTIDGEPLVQGQDYYVVSAIWGAGGGGVKPGKIGDSSSCSYSVLQENRDVHRGTPVKFNIVNGKNSKYIFEGSTALEIEFVRKPNCAESSIWRVAYDESESSSSPWLVIGGPKDHPDSELARGVFRIEKLNGFAYKLAFCPENSSDRISSRSCYNVGRHYDRKYGTRSLVLVKEDSENVFPVVFLNADQSSDKGKYSII